MTATVAAAAISQKIKKRLKLFRKIKAEQKGCYDDLTFFVKVYVMGGEEEEADSKCVGKNE